MNGPPRLSEHEKEHLIQVAAIAIRSLADRGFRITRTAAETIMGAEIPNEKLWRDALDLAQARRFIEPGENGGWIRHRDRVRWSYLAAMANDGTNILNKTVRMAILIGSGTQGIPISGDAITRKKRRTRS